MDKRVPTLLGHLAPNELAEICSTRIQRETRVVGYKHNGDITIIEVAIDRGRLEAGEPPRWHKAKKLRFAPDTSVDEGISTIFENCFDHWMVNEPAVLNGGDAEALHQMRVALRRTRSALTVFGSVLPMMQARWLKTECQWVGDALGAARNWDVFLDDILAPLEARRPGDKSLAALREQCLRARARNYETACQAIGSPRYTTLVLNFNRWIEEAD